MKTDSLLSPVSSTAGTPKHESTRVLTPTHRQAMSMKFAKKPHSAIAKELGIHHSTVNNWFSMRGILYRPYSDYVESILQPKIAIERTHTHALGVAERLKEAAPRALENVILLGDSATNEAVKLSANKDILDRAGYMPVQKMIQIHAVEEMSVNELDSMVRGVLGKADERIASAAPPIYKEADSIDVPSLDTLIDIDSLDVDEDS